MQAMKDDLKRELVLLEAHTITIGAFSTCSQLDFWTCYISLEKDEIAIHFDRK